MCTNTEEQVNSSSTVKTCDVNITINKQQKLKYGASNLNTNDNFRTQTNIAFITNRKIKLCLLMNIVITLVCISISYVLSCKLYMDLLQLQNEMITLNARFENLADKCDEISQMVMREPPQTPQQEPYTNEPQARTQQAQAAEEIYITDGALAAHFKGSVPEIHIKNQGLVGPWYLDSTVSRQYKFPKFHLTEGQCSIEVTEPALYLIYAQVYYITSSAINSYTVFVRSEGSSQNNVIAKCSTIGPNSSHSSEISCYTSTVHSLKANDRVFIQQTEKNRTIILRDGHSFFGLVRLNNSVRNK